MNCPKKCFLSRSEAKKFRKKWNLNNPKKKPLTYDYKCKKCGCYHNTSMPKSMRYSEAKKNR